MDQATLTHHRSEVLETIAGLEKAVQQVETMAHNILVVLADNRARLANGQPIGRLNTLFGVTDMAAKVNTASRWEGRLKERIELGHEAELAAELAKGV